MPSMEDFSPDQFLSPPAGIGGKAAFDASGLIRFIDTMMQGWVAGKLALAEGDVLPAALGSDPAWLSYVSRHAIVALLAKVEGDVLPTIQSKILGLASQFPEVQGAVQEAAQKLDTRIDLARAARTRLAAGESISPLRQSLDHYTSTYTVLNVSKARVPLDAPAVEDARKQVALHYDGVTRAHAILKGGLDVIITAAGRFSGGVANLPPQKVTPNQWRSALEYDTLVTVLKAAWSFPVPPAPAALPASRGNSWFGKLGQSLTKKR